MADGNPYAPPQAVIAAAPPRTPGVWTAYVVYCIGMALLYLALVGVGVAFSFVMPEEEMAAGEAVIISTLLVGLGLLFAVPYAAAPFLPRRPGTWILGLVLIGIGLTSCLTLPVAIPLLLYWIKPENQLFFGRTAIIK